MSTSRRGFLKFVVDGQSSTFLPDRGGTCFNIDCRGSAVSARIQNFIIVGDPENRGSSAMTIFPAAEQGKL